jgi:hypothetical protein
MQGISMAVFAICPLTSQPIEAPMLRIQVEPSPESGPLS